MTPTLATILGDAGGSITHLAYHLSALRQIAKGTRGPKEETFGLKSTAPRAARGRMTHIVIMTAAGHPRMPRLDE